MKLILDDNQLNQAPEQFLRQAGYAYLVDRKTGNESFVRSFNRGYYPRFHLYLERQNGKIILNLHLDQKQASYAGAHAHNAEYDGEAVAEERERIKQRITHNVERLTQNVSENVMAGQNILDKIRPKQFTATSKKVEKKSWWRFWE